ncbi:hypothetical protein RIR_jg18423.t1 [Rhizophagus irregularis DAOM 181602=DAOM 197198]|nr:hypothetical protein RIR_jg18423.t1 [Rhizophagus irregularis DAOM 181602=DAOM 197198]
MMPNLVSICDRGQANTKRGWVISLNGLISIHFVLISINLHYEISELETPKNSYKFLSMLTFECLNVTVQNNIHRNLKSATRLKLLSICYLFSSDGCISGSFAMQVNGITKFLGRMLI